MKLGAFLGQVRVEKCEYSLKVRVEKCKFWAKDRAEKCNLRMDGRDYLL